MTENKHGGKREGSGRPKGSIKINTELQQSFREHTETALNSIVAIAADKEHQHHLKACELILSRGYGNTKSTPMPAMDMPELKAASDIPAYFQAINGLLANGEISESEVSESEVSTLLSVVGGFKQSIDVAQLEQRIEALECK